MTDLAADIVRQRSRCILIHTRRKLSGSSLRGTGVRRSRPRSQRNWRRAASRPRINRAAYLLRGKRSRTAVGRWIVETVSRQRPQHHTSYHRMHINRQRIAARALTAGNNIDRPALISRVAGREIRDAATSVPVPGARAKPPICRFHVGDGHIRSSVRKERPIGVLRHRLGSPLAVGRHRSTHLTDLRKVQRDADYLWAERNGRYLAHRNTGV